MKFIKSLVVIILVVSIFIFATAIYVFSGIPRNLGVKFTKADYDRTHQKFGVEVETQSTATSVKDSLRYSGKKDIKIVLDSVEVTSYLNAETWAYAPISNLQVKINPDNTGEISGVLNLDNLLPFISMTTPTEEVNKAIEKFKISAHPPFYATGTVSVTNNNAVLNVSSLEIGRIPVPSNYITENIGSVNKFASDRIKAVPNLQVRSLTLADGKVNLDATVPEKVSKLVK